MGDRSDEFETDEDRATSAPLALPELHFDPKEHVDEFDDLDLSHEQKVSLAYVLWHWMVELADLAWGVSAAQLACGQNADTPRSATPAVRSEVKSKSRLTTEEFDRAAGLGAGKAKFA